jgi:hypothetical protein
MEVINHEADAAALRGDSAWYNRNKRDRPALDESGFLRISFVPR